MEGFLSSRLVASDSGDILGIGGSGLEKYCACFLDVLGDWAGVMELIVVLRVAHDCCCRDRWGGGCMSLVFPCVVRVSAVQPSLASYG